MKMKKHKETFISHYSQMQNKVEGNNFTNLKYNSNSAFSKYNCYAHKYNFPRKCQIVQLQLKLDTKIDFQHHHHPPPQTIRLNLEIKTKKQAEHSFWLDFWPGLT